MKVGSKEVFKAGSALAGGVASMGETCGGLAGAIMALGLVVGRERLEDMATYQKAKAPAQELYPRFRQETGHSLCAEIHKIKYGRTYRMWIPDDAVRRTRSLNGGDLVSTAVTTPKVHCREGSNSR